MSHICVAVFSNDKEDVGKLLAPYCEEIDGRFQLDGKWDYWQIGGRYEGTLRRKDGTNCSQAQLKDVDLRPDPEMQKKAKLFWEEWVEGHGREAGKRKFESWRQKEHFIRKYKSRETYVAFMSTPGFYAYVTPDGKWVEDGENGVSIFLSGVPDGYSEELTEFVKKCSPETWMTIIDCHD